MTKIPMPGQPVRGSRSGAPIMALFDLLGRHWAMGVLWTLCEIGPSTFRRLQEKCETISPAALNTRLKELQAAGFVYKSDEGYAATELGLRLYDQLCPLGDFAKDWAVHLTDNRESDQSSE
ncbi:winged helix-turn-helix transcriptional regulator [Cohaesibacter gelatinilyticus]|uniref:Transcriptional regulator, HxlR family n=1 Tax=Cohaesibacter gelatinilyticus TaxID=372072 RepID=A0A285PN14_9HYPH|nr:helix-turn-helix domain-containing protein [Cohaesibacter gelatinilyticus]SNZ21281.1 transcriptional regulator, HxlR family [Cohaesibacter gelatinilyticus]